ncbi:hypothetical protein ACEOHC_003888 [Salmonella enterica]
MKRVWNIKDNLPCIDFDFTGNMYHVWHLKRWCADGELVQVSVRTPGVIIQGRTHTNMLRRELAARQLLVARRCLRSEIADHGGLMPCR